MKEKITNNLGLKLISIALAIFAWFMVVNVVNPLVETSVEVPVEMINEDILKKADLTYELVGKKTVTVTYEVRSRDRYRVTASDFYAYADLADLYDVTGSIPVMVEVSNRNVRNLIEGAVSTKPGVVRIQTEELQKKRFTVIPHITGELDEGYATGTVSVRPEQIYVTGPVSVVGQISSVGVEIDVSGAYADTSGTGKIVLYDANDNPQPDLMDSVTLNRSEAEYQVNILRVKNVGLDFQVSGEVAEGYRFTGVDSDIKSISVEGLKSVLASLNTITVPGELLNLDGATADVTVEVDLNALLPDNVVMANDATATAVVTLRVEQLEERAISLDTRRIELVGMSDAYNYYFDDTKAEIWIRGLSEDLDRLNVDILTGRVDVSALETGDFTVEVRPDLPEGFEWVSSDWLELHVTSRGPGYQQGGEGDAGSSESTEETGETDTEQ